MLCAAAKRRLTRATIGEASRITLRLSCMVMWIVFAAAIFTSLYAAVGADRLVRDALTLLPGGPLGVLIGMQLIWLVMGCLLEPLLSVQCCTCERYDGRDVSLGRYASLGRYVSLGRYASLGRPFVALQATALALMIAFPDLITWLPNTLLR